MENHIYNLMRQLVQEQTSLWRIKNEYTKDADKCGECVAFWEKLAKDKEEHIKELDLLISDCKNK